MFSGFEALGKQPVKVKPPYPIWADSVISIIEDAFFLAGEKIKLKYNTTIQDAEENQITEWLDCILCDFLNDEDIVPGFNYDVFDLPHRDAPVLSHTGGLGRKRPDLVLFRHGNPDNVDTVKNAGWFCECKILDSTHSLYNYVHTNGMNQFVNGDYAASMQQGQMIGFVRYPQVPQYDVENILSAYLYEKSPTSKPTPNGDKVNIVKEPYIDRKNTNKRILITEHNRDFCINKSGKKASSIELRHLWLQLV